MYRIQIAVVDSTRVRFFTCEREVESGSDEIHERFVEHETFKAPPQQQPHAKHDADFARVALAHLAELDKVQRADHVILCAGPHMLGVLRASSHGLKRDHQIVTEVPRDLIKLSTSELREYLADHHILGATSARRIAS